MVNSIRKWFRKPYPFYTETKSKWLISLGFGVFVFLFLLVFKPFNFDLVKNNIFSAFFFGIITSTVIALNIFIFPLIFRNFYNPIHWNVGKEFLFILLIIIFITIFNVLFSITILDEPYRHTIFSFFIQTLLIGAFPLLFYVYITEKTTNNQFKGIAANITDKQQKIVNNKSRIEIKDNSKNDKFSIKITDFYYINYEKNYISVFYNEQGKLKEKLLRVSLNDVEEQLVDFKTIVRCHKSYIVNTQMVERIEGNARGYLLKIPKIDFLIPVSRSFPKELLFTLVK